MSCPTFEALSSAASDEADNAVRAHVDGCSRCRRVVDEVRALAELAKQAPYTPPDPQAVTAGEAALIEASRARTVARAQRRGRLVGAGVTALAAAAAVLVAVMWRPAEPPQAAEPTPSRPAELAREPAPSITAASTARYERRTRRGSDGRVDEVLALEDGEITLAVPAMSGDRSFRLAAGDDVVRLSRARVRARAAGGRLARLEVLAGEVEVRPAGAPAATLRVGQTWRAEAPSPAEQQEAAFAAGFEALEGGDPASAAGAFEASLAAAPEGELAEDASFWRATALGRAGDREAAGRAIEGHLARYAGARAAELALVLAGWRREAGRPAGDLLDRALAEGDEEVRARARALRGAP